MKILLSASLAVVCSLFIACGSGDDDDDSGKTEVGTPETPTTTDLSIEETIDQSYSATLSEIQKSWAGQYEGWDDVQERNTKIKRLLTLNSNNTYVNVIQGVIIDSGKSDFVDFEHERGRYSYNARTNTITYTVESDSVLDYRNQKMDGYSGKKYYNHTEGNYTEKVQFSTLTNGTRKWITRDTYLQSLTDKSINIAFAMDPQRPTDERRR